MKQNMHGTTILSVRRGKQVALGALNRIVSPTHNHEFQVFKLVDYCQRRGHLDQLELGLERHLAQRDPSERRT